MFQHLNKYIPKIALGVSCALICGIALVQRPAIVPEFLGPFRPNLDSSEAPKFQTVFDYAFQNGDAHAPALRILSNGFSIIWFEGSREGKSDVQIMETRFEAPAWSSSGKHVLLNSSGVSKAMPGQTVSTLGNTIQFGNSPGRLLATVVSIGGWAMAQVADVTVGDMPTTVNKLNLTPLLNRSYLVKSPTVPMIAGLTGLPTYFEMGNAFSTFALLDESGRVRDNYRISQGQNAIQPTILPISKNQAVAFMRNFTPDSDRLFASWTKNGGRHWSTPEQIALPNPSAPVGAILLSNGEILMAFNDDPVRSDLVRLAISSDLGRNWNRVATLEDHNGEKAKSARYIMMRRLPSGQIALTYSQNSKGGIRAHVFNEAWVRSQ